MAGMGRPMNCARSPQEPVSDVPSAVVESKDAERCSVNDDQ